ncbi:MAG: YdeI/OmpD-associated family protein [Streptosporangiaceae bacterium]
MRLAAPVAAAKSAETRQRRIDKACADLRRA